MENLDTAIDKLGKASICYNDAYREAISTIKEILTPCGTGGCLIGTEDYCSDIYYVYAEPMPNEFRRVMAIRYLRNIDALEVLIDLQEPNEYKKLGTDKEGWMPLSRAMVSDILCLMDEIRCNLEYSNGYQDEDDEFEYLIDEDGSKYNPETSILSGGMDIRCDYNEEALFAYKTRKTIEEITAYLLSKGWIKTTASYHEFRKGNTTCFFDDWRDADSEEHTDGGGYFVCFGTEYRPEDIEALTELKQKLYDSMEKKKYRVPFLRTQYADVCVDATDERDAIDKAKAIFNEGHDGDIDWEDIYCPEYDKYRGVELV